MMRNWFTRQDPKRAQAARLCDAVFKRALEPPPYQRGWVSDSMDGRFLMVALHGALVLRRIKALDAGAALVAEKLGESIFDRFDYGLREEGVGDSSIARKIRKLGERFYGLASALDEALDQEVISAVEKVLVRNVTTDQYAGDASNYTVEAEQYLSGLDDDAFLSGQLDWPSV